jgi:catalase (peroxidase I)
MAKKRKYCWKLQSRRINMNIDEAIKLINDIKKEYGTMVALGEYVTAIETLINEYSNLKQIEEAHRIENGELREKIKQLEDIDSHIPRID